MTTRLIISEQSSPHSGSRVAETGIANLRERFRGEVIHPGHEAYDAARKIWNGAVDRYPALIARCRGAADVLTALQFARERALPVAIRGGGHGVGGTAVCDDGVVVDCTLMKGIRVDPAALRKVVDGLFRSVVDDVRESRQSARDSVDRIRTLLGNEVGGILPFATIVGAGRRALKDVTGVPESVERALLEYFFNSAGYRTIDGESVVAPVHLSDIRDAVALPDIKKRMLELGLEAQAGPPEEIAARLKDDIAKWAKVIDDAHIPKL